MSYFPLCYNWPFHFRRIISWGISFSLSVIPQISTSIFSIIIGANFSKLHHIRLGGQQWNLPSCLIHHPFKIPLYGWKLFPTLHQACEYRPLSVNHIMWAYNSNTNHKLVVSKPNINVMYLNFCLFVGPYIHNTIIYECITNVQNTFNCWLQFW